jgi:hypothetical protein
MFRILSRLVVVTVVSCCLALTLQGWVGSVTIYAPELRVKREHAHAAIVANLPPDSIGWSSWGMRGNAIRVGVPFTVDWLARYTGTSQHSLYRYLDTLLLALLMSLLWLFLRAHGGDAQALTLMLLVACLLPLTYRLHFFQPWDRASSVTWLAGIWLVRANRPLTLAALLPLGVIVKYDVALIFGLYWLAYASVRHWKPAASWTLLLALAGLGTYGVLSMWRPTSFEGGYPLSHQVAVNLTDVVTAPLLWQPLLGLGPLVLLTLLGWHRATRFERAGVGFAACFLGLAFFTVNLQEMRALMPAAFAFCPCAMRGLASAFDSSHDSDDAIEAPSSPRA